jgi:rare lipoprotein A
MIRVTHLGNGKSVTLKVNDRGPFIEGRILDLSLGAARKLEMIEAGVAKVMIEIVKPVD